MATITRGAARLREKLKPWGAARQLAIRLGIGPDQVSRWLSGALLPNTKHRAFLEDEFGISWRLWDEAGDDSESGDAA
jgi:transcriptional regulator with XRE-family HTH domain